MMMQAQIKAKNSREAAAQKLAQRQLEFNQKLQHEEARTHHEIHRQNLSFLHEQSRAQSTNGEGGE
jgi:hypothetical protein